MDMKYKLAVGFGAITLADDLEYESILAKLIVRLDSNPDARK